MRNIILSFWGLLIFLMAGYFLMLMCIMFTTKKTMQEANESIAKMVSDFVSFVRSPSTTDGAVTYPTLIGYDGVNNISSTYVQEVFSSIGKYYGIWYFEYAERINAERINNVVVYRFKVYDCLIAKRNRQNIRICLQKIGERALTEWLHDSGTYSIDVRKLLTVQLRADSLVYVIALNEKGVQEIANLKKSIH